MDKVGLLWIYWVCYEYSGFVMDIGQGKKKTAIFNRLYIRLYIKFVANNGKNHDSAHAAISFCP